MGVHVGRLGQPVNPHMRMCRGQSGAEAAHQRVPVGSPTAPPLPVDAIQRRAAWRLHPQQPHTPCSPLAPRPGDWPANPRPPIATPQASNQVDSAYLERAARSCPHLTATVRAAVVDFMVDAAWRLRLTCDTVSLAVGLLDRYLAAVSRGDARAPGGKGLRLCAAVCVWVAAK